MSRIKEAIESARARALSAPELLERVYTSQSHDTARALGRVAFTVGKDCSPCAHWVPSMRQAYTAGYDAAAAGLDPEGHE